MDADTSRRLWSSASEEELRARFYRYPDKDYESWLGHFGYSFGFNYDYPHELTSRVAAGIVSYQARMSLQTALKYARNADREDKIPRYDRLFQALNEKFTIFTILTTGPIDRKFLMNTRDMFTPNSSYGVVSVRSERQGSLSTAVISLNPQRSCGVRWSKLHGVTPSPSHPRPGN